MREIGLFPLPLVLLPGERVPLHVFEPRYKELIGECVAGGGEFGIVLADGEALHEIGTAAVVEEVLEVLEDGRMNVVVAGRERFRVLELTSGRSFRTATVETLEDEAEEPPEAGEAERAAHAFEEVAALAGSPVERPPADDLRLSFALAGRVELASGLKQELLELRSERERLRRVADLLEGAAATMREEQALRERAATNGRGWPRP